MKYKICDIAEIIDGDRGVNYPKREEFSHKGYCLFLNTGNVTIDGFSFEDKQFITKEKDKVLRKGKLKKNDIVYTTRGTIGNVGFYSESVPFENIRINSGMIIIRGYKDKVNQVFLYHLLKSNCYRRIFLQFSSGSAQPQLPIKSFAKIKIDLPNLNEQSKIASILSAYDNLIENNNKRIKILEQMAENLYKEWFVRFHFPNHEQETIKSSALGKIPSSFQILKMQDVISYYIGGGWGNDDKSDAFPIEAFVIRGTDFPYVEKGDLSTCPIRFHKESNFMSRQLQANDIIIEISGGTAEQPVGRALYISNDLVQRLKSAVICASFCKLVRLNKSLVSPLYFYYWLKYLYETRTIEKFQLQSTGIINFKFDYFLRKGEILLPSNDLMTAFEKQVLPLRMEIEKLAQQNQNLIKQRDLLLPRLMSGKLEV